MRKVLYPGSFDPITYGHINIIKRLSPLFDQVIVVVANSSEKKYLFNPEERKELIQKCIGPTENIRVEFFNGLTVDFAQEMGAQVIVRGLRAVSDFEYEMSMANVNNKLDSSIETMIMFSDPEYSFVSSKMVKEAAQLGADLSELVPEPVELALKNKF